MAQYAKEGAVRGAVSERVLWLTRGAFQVVAVTLMLMVGGSVRAGYSMCIQPHAPDLFIVKPSKPFCAATRSCSSFDVSNYQDDVDRYYKKLKAYLADVDQFQSEAYDYAKCMADIS